MKSIGIVEDESGLWNWPNDGATNSIGFSGAPGGGRLNYGDYFSVGGVGYWWSSSEGDTDGALNLILGDDDGVYRGDYLKRIGFSVRCLRD